MRTPKKWFRKENATYYVQINGKQIALGKDAKKAETEANRLVQQSLREGGRETPNDVTFHNLIDEYQDYIKRHNAPSKYECTAALFRDLKKATTPELLAHDFKPITLDKFIAARKRVKSDTTKALYIEIVSGVYNWGCKYALVTVNPIGDMPKPTKKTRQDYIPESRFAEFYSYLPNDAIKDFFTVQLETGARTMEMFAMEAQHFDGEKITFLIENSKGKKRSRVIYMTPRALVIVKRLATEHPIGKLFRNKRGRPFGKNAINKYSIMLKTKLKMPGFCGTTLRHSFAHFRLSNGQDAVTVAKLMGHVDTAMIMKIYGHLDGSDYLAREAARFTMQPETGPAKDDGQAANGESESNAPAGDAA